MREEPSLQVEIHHGRVGEHGILQDAPALVVHEPEVGLRAGDTLVGGETVPADRFGIVLRHAFAAGIFEPAVELRGGIALLSRHTEPADRFGASRTSTTPSPNCAPNATSTPAPGSAQPSRAPSNAKA